MPKYFSFFIFSAIGLAEEITLSFENHLGESSYTVIQPSQNLKAELIFPFDFNTLNLYWKKNIYDLDLELGSSFLVYRSRTNGKDSDWKENQLTVLSNSQNHIEKFHAYDFKISKQIIENVDFFTKLKYQTLNFSWDNTIEKNFINNTTTENNKLSLEYQQKTYQFNLGLTYTKVFDDLMFKIEPTVIYAHIFAKDIHTLRDFYTEQVSNAFGYGIKIEGSILLTSNSSLSLYYNRDAYQEKDTEMRYYNRYSNNYLTLPSSYSYKNSRFGLSYIYSF